MMASKLSQIDDLVHNTFQGLWKLKDSVKIKIGVENFKTTRHGAEFEQMQETKVYIAACMYGSCSYTLAICLHLIWCNS